MKLSPQDALKKLNTSDKPFIEVFQHGSLSVEIYKPVDRDLQQPHTRDEIYVVISGEGIFFSDGHRYPFGPGDFLFVPAGIEHRFETFSGDFATWVFFYGPEGGERALNPDRVD